MQVQPCAARWRSQASRSSWASCSRPGPPSPERGELAGEVLLQPRADLGAERLVLGGVGEIHVRYPTKHLLGLETLPALLRAAAERYGDQPAYVEGSADAVLRRPARPRAEQTAAATPSSGLARRPGRALGAQQHRVGRRRARRLVRRRRAGARQQPLHRARGGRHRRPHRGPRWSWSRRVPRPHPGRRARRRRRVGAGRRRSGPGQLGPPRRATVPRRSAPDDVADILFTSGTTGRPKGAMSAHRQTIGVARAWAELGGVSADDRYLVVNPFFHSFGYKIGIVVGLLTGATLYPVATFDVDETMRLIQDERITVFPGAPTLYQSLLDAPGPRRARPVLAAARRDRRGRGAGRADRADARPSPGPGDRQRGDGVRDDRGRGRDDVPRRRLGRDGRRTPAVARSRAWRRGSATRASCCCAATT